MADLLDDRPLEEIQEEEEEGELDESVCLPCLVINCLLTGDAEL